MVKSISFNQQEIIQNILKLYCISNRIDLDPTYSKGAFYLSKEIEDPIYKFDINPLYKIPVADVRNLPIRSNSLFTIIFDPPFMATRGPSLKVLGDGNVIAKRFGCFPTEKELHKFYVKAMKELYRVLKENGILIFKCQDKVSSGKQYLSHVFIINEAIKMGFYCKDIFVLLAKSRIYASWQVRNQ